MENLIESKPKIMLGKPVEILDYNKLMEILERYKMEIGELKIYE